MSSWCGWDNPFRGRGAAKGLTRLVAPYVDAEISVSYA